ncbi:MAG: phytanoyl-CoA dioxygenase family protein [Armatimonadetes bacterium]|nr:phytanoyl-CoA dioxygenase family protein [Armatimonadota bacterium]
MAAINEEQESFYREQGYVLVSGLIAPEIVKRAEVAMWQAMGLVTGDPSGWPRSGVPPVVSGEPVLTACYTPEMLAAAARLAGGDPQGFAPPASIYALNVFPQPGEWRWPGPHIDHAIREDGYRTFPRAFRIAAMTYLHDVPAHGGGTVVWPGSARKVEILARSDPERYETMWALNQDVARAGIGEPVELTPRQGDVLFYHYLCAHAGSMNTSGRPRLAFNMKW